MARLIFLAVLVACVVGAQAYPSLWAGESGVKCPDHPKKGEDGHGAPTLDSAIKFATADSAGKALQAICPGDTVTVTVTFPSRRLALLTANFGSFDKSTPNCPARRIFDRTTGALPAATHSTVLKVPCGQTNPITLKVTSATGSTSAFLQSTATLPVNPACKKC